MSNIPHTIAFGRRQVRTVVMNGVRKFSATDICNILGYVNPNKIINRYCDSTPEYVRLATTGGPQNCRMIEAKDIRDILSHYGAKISFKSEPLRQAESFSILDATSGQVLFASGEQPAS